MSLWLQFVVVFHQNLSEIQEHVEANLFLGRLVPGCCYPIEIPFLFLNWNISETL